MEDLGSPNILLRGVAATEQRFKTAPVGGIKFYGDPRAHTPDSQAPPKSGTPNGTQTLDLLHKTERQPSGILLRS